MHCWIWFWTRVHARMVSSGNQNRWHSAKTCIGNTLQVCGNPGCTTVAHTTHLHWQNWIWVTPITCWRFIKNEESALRMLFCPDKTPKERKIDTTVPSFLVKHPTFTEPKQCLGLWTVFDIQTLKIWKMATVPIKVYQILTNLWDHILF